MKKDRISESILNNILDTKALNEEVEETKSELEDGMLLEVYYEDGTVTIGTESSSGAEYPATTAEDLKNAFSEYVDNYVAYEEGPYDEEEREDTARSTDDLNESDKPLDLVFTLCGGTLDVWQSRQDAMDFFEICIGSSDGSERERYTNVYFDLKDGALLAVDDYDDDSVWSKDINWMGKGLKDGFSNKLATTNLEDRKSAKDVVNQIKSGKIMPPKEFLDSLEESAEVLTESDATDEFLNDLKNFLNKYCRVNIESLTLVNGGEAVSLNGTSTIDIGADSNLAAVKDIVSYLLKD